MVVISARPCSVAADVAGTRGLDGGRWKAVRAEGGERRAESGERRAESGERRAEGGGRRAEGGGRKALGPRQTAGVRECGAAVRLADS